MERNYTLGRPYIFVLSNGIVQKIVVNSPPPIPVPQKK